MKKYFLFLFFNPSFLFLNLFCLQPNVYGQAKISKIDSLLILLKKDKEDSNKVIHFNKLSIEYRTTGSFDSSIIFAGNALKIAQQLNPIYKKGIATSYANLGSVNREQGNYPRALDFFLKALRMDEELNDKIGMAKRLGNIGIVYDEQGDNKRALEYYLKALKTAEELGAKNLIATCLGNMALIYTDQANYQEALNYYFRALKIDEETENEKSIATCFGNIGNVYGEQGKSEESIVKRNELFNNALRYFHKALKLSEELENVNGVSRHLANIGLLNMEQGKYREAYNYLYRALGLADSIGAMNNVKQWYQMLSTLYEKSTVLLPDSFGGKIVNREQMRLRALYYHKQYIALRDTLFSEENKKQLVRKEMNFEFEKKEASVKAEQDKKDAVAAADAKRQRMVLLLVSFVLLLVAVVAFIIFRSLRITRRQKTLIERQKHLVEEHQKEILDSIYYARRIQRSLLTSEKYIERNLNKLIKSGL